MSKQAQKRNKGSRKPNSRKSGPQFTQRERDVESMDMRSEKRLPKFGHDPRECSTDNDPMWYAVNEQLLKDVGSYSFTWPLGDRLPYSNDEIYGNNAIPGIFAIYTNFTPGVAVNQNSPVNTAARNIYSYVRHANSGHANYDAPDLMLYLLAMDSIYAFHSFLKRVYGVASVFTYENRYLNEALLRAMRVNPQSVRSNLADLRAFINLYAVKIGSLCIPNSMPFMARHMWMYQNYYVDSDTPKAQIYLYTPNMFFRYGLDSTGKGMLYNDSFSRENDAEWNVDDLIQYGYQLIDAVLASEDMNIMSGDILKAFGADGVYKSYGIEETYQVLPTYSPEVQSQIENLTALGNVVRSQTPENPVSNGESTCNVYQVMVPSSDGVDSYLYTNPNFTFITELRTAVDPANTVKQYFDVMESAMQNLLKAWSNERMINMHKTDVTPSDVMVATRLCNTATLADSENLQLNSTTLGSDYVTHCAIYWYAYNPTTQTRALSQITGISQMLALGEWAAEMPSTVPNAAGYTTLKAEVAQAATNTAASATRLKNLMTMIANFDWHPQFHVYDCGVSITSVPDTTDYAGGVDSAVHTLVPFVDTDTYALIDTMNLENMATVALLSEFNVPQMGAFSRKI